MTLQEFWSSLTINTKDKIKNPFFGSLVLVWVIFHHSELYRLLFCYQDHKKEMNDLNTLFAVDENLVLIIIKTLGVMVLSYFVLALTNLFVMSYTNQVVPMLMNISSKGAKVVAKTKYDQLLDEYSSINTKHNQLIEERNQAVSTRLTLQQERDKAKLESRESDLKQQGAVNEKTMAERMLLDEQAKVKGLEQTLTTERMTHEGVNHSLKSALKDTQQAKQDIADLQQTFDTFKQSQLNIFKNIFMTSSMAANKVVNELKFIDVYGKVDVTHNEHFKAFLAFGYVATTESGALELTTLGKLLLRTSLEAANGVNP